MCFFCNLPDERIIHESDNFYVIRDGYAVTPLHTLFISKQHWADWFDLSIEEQAELNSLIRMQANELLEEDPEIAGFNIGMNCGEAAGQTVMHFHAHLIPRRKGDMEDPRGGVRGVIPEKQKY
jgi:diadenosine tetraphosphate (Ap4A) HIT family hydrolase